MISVSEAFSILENLTFSPIEKKVSLWEARNFVLAETLFSPINMPPFRQSNMDGYAIALHEGLEFTIIGEIKAGDEHQPILKPGEAVKIFTGAAVPDWAEAVIQIEKATANDNRLVLQEKVSEGTNVRPMGSQILQNAIALERGTYLNAAAIGFLAGLGFTAVKVYQKPKVAIVITGNELVAPGMPLPYGKVYESNAIMLKSALYDCNYEEVVIYQVDDDYENTKTVLEKALIANDVILVSGGISVGDYDFVGRALKSLEVETLFYKVNQKPGKPLLVGKLKDKIIFALPGNPAAGLTCFYIHVLPTLQRFSGMKASYQPATDKRLAHDFEVGNSRELFLKAKWEDDCVTILAHQDSSMLDSFAMANALVYLPSGNYRKIKGDKVAVYIL
jgi:molybdopterin molybdotransferase